MIWGISLIVLSILAVPSLLLSKKPNAKELLEKSNLIRVGLDLYFVFGVSGVLFLQF